MIVSFFAALIATVLVVDLILGRRVARRMNAECDGLSWTGQNGQRYAWRSGRIVRA